MSKFDDLLLEFEENILFIDFLKMIDRSILHKELLTIIDEAKKEALTDYHNNKKNDVAKEIEMMNEDLLAYKKTYMFK